MANGSNHQATVKARASRPSNARTRAIRLLRRWRFSNCCLRALIASHLIDRLAVAPAVFVFTVSATEGITQRLAQRTRIAPGVLRVYETEHATRAEFPVLRVDAAVDVFKADPLRGLDTVENLDRYRLFF